MHSIKLFPSCAIIVRIFLLCGPHSVNLTVLTSWINKLKVGNTLSESWDILCGDFHVDLHEFLLDHKCLILGVNEYFTILWIVGAKFKPELVGSRLEVVHGQSVWVVLLSLWHDIFRNIPSFILGI
jgi:hypothetical protein